MRSMTTDFTPWHGCLFSVELDDMATSQAFYDNLNFHEGIHLGALFTLAFAYIMHTYKRRLSSAGKDGLTQTWVMISAVLGDTETLLMISRSR
jgi:cystathionine gamma-synthase